MRYFNAYRMTGDNGTKWLFTRCGECAALVAEIDQETHTEWHESEQRRRQQIGLQQQKTWPTPSWPVENQP